MSAGTMACLLMAGIFLILAMIFALLKEKGAMLISGFNTLPKAQRETYDQLRLSQDTRNTLLLWTGIFVVGGVCAHFLSQYAAIITFILWFILFFRDFHFDARKAFEKYKR